MKILVKSLDETSETPILKVEVSNKLKKAKTLSIPVDKNFSVENLKGLVLRELKNAEKEEVGVDLAKSLVGKEIKV